MIKAIFSYIKSQSLKFKILFAICLILFISVISYSVRLAYANHKLVKKQKQIIENLNVQLEVSENKTTEIVSTSKKITVKTSKKQEDIKIKLKEDEKVIDNDSISDDDIRLYISNHNKR